MSHRSAGRPRLYLLGLCHHALSLPLLSQSPLSDLPAGRHANLVSPATGALAPGAVLPDHLHPALKPPRARAAPAPYDLHVALSELGGGAPTTGPGSALCGWA